MGRSLVERFAWASSLARRADEWIREAGGEPVSDLVFGPIRPPANQRLIDERLLQLSQTVIAQPSICLASLLWARYLEHLGIKPVAVGGHSLGELTAFHFAGAFDERDLLRFAALRGKVMAISPDTAGAMASLSCSRGQAEAILEQVEDYTVVANINSPRQTVIWGAKRGVHEALRIAETRGIAGRELPVSNAFHSRLVAGAAEFLREHAPVPAMLGQTLVTVFSGINGERVPPGTDLREHFSRQVRSQVDFVALVQSLAETCDVMLEVGPGKVLSGLVRQIRGADGPTCLPIESRPGSNLDTNVVLATLFVHGSTTNRHEF